MQWPKQAEGLSPPVGVDDGGQDGFGAHGGAGQDLYGAGSGSVQQVCGVN